MKHKQYVISRELLRNLLLLAIDADDKKSEEAIMAAVTWQEIDAMKATPDCQHDIAVINDDYYAGLSLCCRGCGKDLYKSEAERDYRAYRVH